MKKCQSCGFDNTDIMNYCLECGNALANQPQMVIPLDSLSGQEDEKQTEQVTEVYENETVVKSRFAPQQSFQTFQQQPQPPKNSNAKLFIAIGGGLFAVFALFGVVALGFVFYAVQNQSQTRARPIVSKTPVRTNPTPYPKEDFPPVEDPPPVVRKDPNTKEEPITFPAPKTATKRGKYEVKAIPKWQLSNIRTVKSQNFSVRARGRIKLDGIKRSIGIKGINGHRNRRTFKQYKTGALLMRTHYPDGSHSNIQPVGAGEFWLNAPDETGKIEFLINDNSQTNGSGSFKVTVKDLGVQRN